jgi:DNA polymerase-3 subunit alpha (Gram-positive type)
MITIFDVETTGLVKAKGSDQITQPFITEFFALKVDEKSGKMKEFETYIKPPIPIPAHIEKLIGITNYMVKDSPSFLDVHKMITKAFFCSHTMVAHNLPFDLECLRLELERIGKEHQFPYPPIHFCTVEQSMHIKGHRLKIMNYIRLPLEKIL